MKKIGIGYSFTSKNLKKENTELKAKIEKLEKKLEKEKKVKE